MLPYSEPVLGWAKAWSKFWKERTYVLPELNPPLDSVDKYPEDAVLKYSKQGKELLIHPPTSIYVWLLRLGKT